MVAVGANQVEASLVMSLLAFGFADIVEKRGGEQTGAGSGEGDGRLPSPARRPS